MSETLKAFQCSDNDWYAAKDAKEAAELHEDLCGDAPEDPYPVELTDEDLDRPLPEFDEDEQETGIMTSIRKMLVEHGESPGWLAGTE